MKKETTILRFKTTGDALPPVKTEFGAMVRIPLDVSIPPNGGKTMDLCVECDKPLLVVPTRQAVDAGAEDRIRVLLPGSRLSITFVNSTPRPYVIEERSSILLLFPIGADVDVLEG